MDSFTDFASLGIQVEAFDSAVEVLDSFPIDRAPHTQESSTGTPVDQERYNANKAYAWCVIS
uniref:Pheromone n=1 Tax=Coprinopsis cinerea TaxID=5346 RepID=O74279_COPCI|nr:pheromone [Coprinopsis cinerea]